ncbi:uncharacterized protein B0H18DRAFT_636989 [Fomitopsis serialis]|uniref:uncharacterized protein n=1 Tax=Fomitopsis serialis TaxID=139415 RepID=UPI0020085521|nr:uncharacterized protein B0H18DRAFT_636989 [Neoantrodia serialis]KAH9919422.1 hypothetical protein B0H18DRAFT_636989 [Neoantrodia serialis]
MHLLGQHTQLQTRALSAQHSYLDRQSTLDSSGKSLHLHDDTSPQARTSAPGAWRDGRRCCHKAFNATMNLRYKPIQSDRENRGAYVYLRRRTLRATRIDPRVELGGVCTGSLCQYTASWGWLGQTRSKWSKNCALAWAVGRRHQSCTECWAASALDWNVQVPRTLYVGVLQNCMQCQQCERLAFRLGEGVWGGCASRSRGRSKESGRKQGMGIIEPNVKGRAVPRKKL